MIFTESLPMYVDEQIADARDEANERGEVIKEIRLSHQEALAFRRLTSMGYSTVHPTGGRRQIIKAKQTHYEGIKIIFSDTYNHDF
ncbi:hypothetical protein [Desulforhopalus sp. 52FAK]